MSLRPISGASLGLALVHDDVDDDLPAERLAFELPQTARYVDGGLIGRGGMGEIRSVYDGRLGRTLAIKTPVDRDRAAASQLIAEATLTARLVHPGIVAVHDAGCATDGRPYYTMPIVHGCSLAEAIADAEPSQRLRLVRHFLDACEAIAYAHSQGVLHRDLKPSNIMVGRFGETIVVDWGLAGPVGARTPGVVGTRAYMPPEQARREPLGPAADVFALGVTLREILTGTPRGPLLDAKGTPPELLAIVERATQASSAARYPDGRALAQDVAAWFEGRRVAAHRYSLQELLARVWTAYRVPLVIALLAVVGIAIATGIGYRRTAVEHARAQRSEHEAIAARERSDRSLARAEVAQALEATAQGSWPQAELFAAGALMHGPSASARGVLARFDTAARPRLERRLALPRCARTAVSSGGDAIACASNGAIRLGSGGDSWSAAWSAAPLDVRGDPVAMVGSTVLVDDGQAGLVVVDAETPAGRVLLRQPGSSPHSFLGRDPGSLAWVSGISEQWATLGPELRSDGVETTAWCSDHASVPGVAGFRSDGSRVAVCQDGRVFMSSTREGADVRERLRLSPSLGAPLVLAFSRSGTRYAAVGLAGGSAVVLDLEEGLVVRTFASNAGTPFDLALTESRLALSDGRGSVYVWEIDSGALLVRLAAQVARVRWLDEGLHLRVIGSGIEDWALPSTRARPHVRAAGAGIAALSLSPDGRYVITAHGDGVVRVAPLDGSDATVEIPLCASVVKDVESSPDGRYAVAVCAQDEHLHVIDLRDPQHPVQTPSSTGMRVAWLAGDPWLLAPYGGGLEAWRDGVPEPSPLAWPHARVLDMESDADRSGVTVLDQQGTIHRIDAAASVPVRVLAERPQALAVAGRGDEVFVASLSTLERISGGASLEVPVSGSSITELALSPDGRWLATGHHDGRVRVWSTATLEVLALLQGHVSRVSALAFDATDEWLVSGSWDGDVRQWSLRALELPPATVLAEAEAAWGLTLDALLETQAGESRGM